MTPMIKKQGLLAKAHADNRQLEFENYKNIVKTEDRCSQNIDKKEEVKIEENIRQQDIESLESGELVATRQNSPKQIPTQTKRHFQQS